MSKRVANTRATTARNGRVRIGWRKKRMLTILENQQEQLALGKLDDAAKAAFDTFKNKARQILPKKFLRRVQAG